MVPGLSSLFLQQIRLDEMDGKIPFQAGQLTAALRVQYIVAAAMAAFKDQ